MSFVSLWTTKRRSVDSVEVSLRAAKIPGIIGKMSTEDGNAVCTRSWDGAAGSESRESRRKGRTSSFSSASVLPICLSLFALLLALQVGTINAEVSSPPLITKQPPTDIILFQVAQRVDENDKPFIIECEAEGSPEPQYTWIKNGKKFDWQAYDNRILQQPGRGTLVVTEPRDEDIGQYQCFATNSFGTATSNSVFLRKAELNAFKDDVAVETVFAEEGKPFQLPCNAPDGWPKPRVDWMLQNSQGAFKNINSSRMTVDPEGTLWFSNVTRNDKSLDFNYACSAYSPFRHEYKLGNRVYLNVNPTTVSAVQNKHAPTAQYMSKRQTVAIRGQTLELWCIVGGTPLPEIRWSRKAGRLPFDRVTYDNYGKTMRISEVTFNDTGSYDCDASNGVGQPVSYSIDVKVESAPYFTSEPEVVNAAEEETIEFHCTAEGIPGPIIRWIHNGKPIEEAAPNPRRTLEGDKIIIRDITKMDTGNYGCNASNTFGYVYKDVYVNVLALPPEITDPPKDVVAIEGTNALITCRVFGAPRPLVRWIRKDKELTGGNYDILANGDLSITSVGFLDRGPYSCFATNKFGNATASGTLDVKAPTVIKEGPENYQVAAGHPVKFSCTAVADESLDLTIEWLNDGAPIDSEANPRYVKMQDNSLTIDKTTELDSGVYTCLAKTLYDNASASANLIVQDVPNRPELVAVECKPRDATVRWMAMGDNRAAILHYTIQFNTSFTPDSWELATTVPASESSYTVSMKPWGNYTFRVTAKNIIGFSLPSVHSEVCTTSEDVPFSNPENVKADKTDPRTLRITWTPMPEIDHNAPNFKYEVQWKEDDDHHTWKTQTVTDWRQSELIIHGQPIYRPYLIKVKAVNSKGDSNVAPAIVRGFSGQDTPTEAPSNFTLRSKIDSKSAHVSWNPVNPESLQGKFEGYKIETWTDADGEDVFRTVPVNFDVTDAIVDKLIPFSRNYLRVYAYNSDHHGPYSHVLEVITDEGLPGPVDELEVRPLGVSSLHLSWNKPEQPNGILLGYQIKYVRVIGTEVKWSELAKRKPGINHPEILSAKLAGLQADTSYRVYVLALTKMGAGEETFVQEKTFADNATVVAKPDFQWDHERSEQGLAAVRVNWKPNFDAPSTGPGSHFYVQYRGYGKTNWINAPEVLNEDYDVVRGLNPGETYLFRVVAVDGSKSAPSDEQEIYTYAIDAPTRRHKDASTITGWYIGLIVALAFLLFVLILVCIIKRNRGGKYAVYEREVAHGRLDYDEGGFREYAQPPAEEPSGRQSLVSDFKPPQESDTDSMIEYGDEAAKFTEDGSFIGQYGVKKKDPNLPSPLATFV